MTSALHRRFGQPAVVYKTHTVTDNRGNEVKAANMDDPITVSAVFVPQRSARAEVPGQVQIDVVRMLVEANLPDVDLWSQVEWSGSQWDVVSPPAYHHGARNARHTRHWTIDLRKRP